MSQTAVQRREALSLASLAGCGGCAAKFAPDDLQRIVKEACSSVLPPGISGGDDAAFYRLDEERALLATLDFFPPLFDDPKSYGRVAAANAVSDIFAMGGTVAFALAILGFPKAVTGDAAARVSRAAADVVEACGGWVLGGHSIHCAEPVFGLAVQGFVHPEKVWRKSGAKPGDSLVLSKSLGTGILISSGDAHASREALVTMSETNQNAAECLKHLARRPSAVTDVTGFGLLGHAAEIAQHSRVRLRIASEQVPVLPEALAWARRGVRTSADVTNRRAFHNRITVEDGVSPSMRRLLFDPQTSGGLLAAIDADDVDLATEQGFVPVGCVEVGSGDVIVG